MSSDAWQSLSPDATKVLLDLWRRHNGTNNGEIAYSRREALECLSRAHGCKVSTRRPNAALKEIQDKGFAVVTKAGSFNIKTKLSRTWRLTAEKVGNDPATRDFRGWQIQNTGTATVPDGDQDGPCDPRRDPEKQAHGDQDGPCNGGQPPIHGDRGGPTSNIPRGNLKKRQAGRRAARRCVKVPSRDDL